MTYSLRIAHCAAPGFAVPDDALCTWTFDAQARWQPGAGDPRRLRVPLQVLDASATTVECWQADQPSRHGWLGEVAYSENGCVAMLQAAVDAPGPTETVEAMTFRVYEALGQALQQLGYPRVWRIWNFLGAINDGEGDAERYRAFCVGRYQALSAWSGFSEHCPPAATAVGRTGRGLHVIVMAARESAQQIENPQQTSAFLYPRQYGPRSPSFSRAMRADCLEPPHLLLSGTASIVGHESLHVQDVEAQIDQTARNIAVLAQAALPGWSGPWRWDARSMWVYLRDPGHWPLVARRLRERFGDVPMRVLQADVCRRELLVEIEAVFAVAEADLQRWAAAQQ